MPKNNKSNVTQIFQRKMRNTAKKVIGKKATKRIESVFGPTVERVRVIAVNAADKVAKKYTGTVKLSPCAQKLALGIAEPFNPAAFGLCLPLYPSLPSHKATVFARFDGIIGTAGVGFVAISPSAANDCPCAFTTTASYTQLGAVICSADNVYNTGVVAVTHNGPYTCSQLVDAQGGTNSKLAARTISVGCRVTYTGTTMNESGMCYFLTSPGHDSLAGHSVSNLGNYTETSICPFTRQPCELTMQSVNASEQSFDQVSNKAVYNWSPATRLATSQDGATSYAYTLTNGFFVGSPCGLFIVTGVAGQSFHVDLVQHMEYIGQSAATSVTPSMIDVSGAQAVLTAAAGLGMARNAYDGLSNWQLMRKGLSSVVAQNVPLPVTTSQVETLVSKMGG